MPTPSLYLRDVPPDELLSATARVYGQGPNQASMRYAVALALSPDAPKVSERVWRQVLLDRERRGGLPPPSRATRQPETPGSVSQVDSAQSGTLGGTSVPPVSPAAPPAPILEAPQAPTSEVDVDDALRVVQSPRGIGSRPFEAGGTAQRETRTELERALDDITRRVGAGVDRLREEGPGAVSTIVGRGVGALGDGVDALSRRASSSSSTGSFPSSELADIKDRVMRGASRLGRKAQEYLRSSVGARMLEDVTTAVVEEWDAGTVGVERASEEVKGQSEAVGDTVRGSVGPLTRATQAVRPYLRELNEQIAGIVQRVFDETVESFPAAQHQIRMETAEGDPARDEERLRFIKELARKHVQEHGPPGSIHDNPALFDEEIIRGSPTPPSSNIDIQSPLDFLIPNESTRERTRAESRELNERRIADAAAEGRNVSPRTVTQGEREALSTIGTGDRGVPPQPVTIAGREYMIDTENGDVYDGDGELIFDSGIIRNLASTLSLTGGRDVQQLARIMEAIADRIEGRAQ